VNCCRRGPPPPHLPGCRRTRDPVPDVCGLGLRWCARSDYKVPHGESVTERGQRIADALNDIAARHAGEKVVVVSHGGVLSNVHELLTGRPVKSAVRCSLCVCGGGGQGRRELGPPPATSPYLYPRFARLPARRALLSRGVPPSPPARGRLPTAPCPLYVSRWAVDCTSEHPCPPSPTACTVMCAAALAAAGLPAHPLPRGLLTLALLLLRRSCHCSPPPTVTRYGWNLWDHLKRHGEGPGHPPPASAAHAPVAAPHAHPHAEELTHFVALRGKVDVPDPAPARCVPCAKAAVGFAGSSRAPGCGVTGSPLQHRVGNVVG
jgi:hypothetical protein